MTKSKNTGAKNGKTADLKSIISRTAKLADTHAKGGGAPVLKRFIRQFYEDSPLEDLADARPEDLYAAAESAFNFAKQRKNGAPSIRVVTPSRGKSKGWPAGHTVIEILNDDMPFLVDSITAELERVGESPQFIIHPVIPVKRDASGKLLDVFEDDEPFFDEAEREKRGVHFESVMHVQVSEEADPDVLDRIGDTLLSVLNDVRRAVTDWAEMRRQATRIAADFDGAPTGVTREQAAEVEDFLHWLHDDHFTFLGYRCYDIETKGKRRVLHMRREDNLGVLSKPSLIMFDGVRDGADVPPLFAQFIDNEAPLLIIKANQRATVHRRVHYDVICVKTLDERGATVALRLFAGMFTADVYTNSPNFVPVLRRKIDRIRDRVGFRKHSHDGKRLQNIMENLPRDELFESSDDHLAEVAVGILHLQERSRTALFVRRDNFERFVSYLVFVPRDRFDTQLRIKFTDILVSAYEGRLSSFFTQVTDSPLARIHFIVATTPGRVPDVDVDALEQVLADASRAWHDDLAVALKEDKGDKQGRAFYDRYAHAFPASYRDQYSCAEAVFDIGKIESFSNDVHIAMHLHHRGGDGGADVHFKVYAKGAPLPLSDVLPVIENIGFTVISEMPHRITPRGSSAGGGPIWIHDFDLDVSNGQTIDLDGVRDRVHEAFAHVWSGAMENDGFNKLVALSGLGWRDVVILRAYAKYLRQAAFPFSQTYIENAFSAHADLARKLIDLFIAKFDPALYKKKKGGAAKTVDKIRRDILAGLDAVSSADEDRILRRYLNLIDSSLRTNFFQTGEDGAPKSYVSIKLNSQTVEDLPRPRPWREIFVYSPRVEAIHLRGGAVARGGLRWSDRLEDFRSEVLGLVKAQMVKNAVIVPTGSKGGFVVKNPPKDSSRDAQQAEGIACYQIMQRGLLDITDNVVKDKIRPPANVVRHDADDPYLVVAADKGTATFSDIANAVSEDEYGHWLGDAYASGGTYGYDHKAMGITAKDAWESVKRHFREMGIDTQKEDFTVIGVGDMSGDVFGNGMLLSKHIRLRAAFNHMHIFVDPDPDAASSWKERSRLFKMGRSSWTDYDTKTMSKGGRIFERSAKSLKVTPEIKSMLGLSSGDITPNDLIKAILQMEIDLLWFGGIGTYVKSEDESHADAADRANDAIRIDARDVGAKVIGEGANLGITQRGRIECGQQGVRLNTDAIDNSAGVDCSDHEVNIKILLNGLVQSGSLTMKARNALLEQMTDEVSDLVLRDNYQQTQTISFVEARGVDVLDAQHRAMKAMERDGLLDRAIEFLPDDETIGERIARGQGLTRPEISVLLPYSKMWLYERVVASDLPDDPMLEDDLVTYFPEPIQKKYKPAILSHKLRREIIATVVTNSFINRVGASFLTAMMERTGLGPVDIVGAYIVTRAAYDIRGIWTDIEALDNKVDASVQIEMLEDVYSMIERSVLWFLCNEPAPMHVGTVLEKLAPQVQAFNKIFDKIVSEDVGSYIESRTQYYVDKGAPRALARRVVSLYRQAAANDLARVSEASKRPISEVADAYFRVGQRFGLGVLRGRARSIALDSHWQKLAVSAAIEEIFSQQTSIAQSVLTCRAKKSFNAEKALEQWIGRNIAGVERFDQLRDDLRSADTINLAMLTVTNRQLSAITRAGGT